MRRFVLALVLFAMSPALSAQEYDTPADHRDIEATLQNDLTQCIAEAGHYETDLSCAENVFNTCLRLSPHGETTVGYAICGGVASNVLDREMNRAWSELKANTSKARFQEVLSMQLNWLAYRSDETQAAARRYPGGSMSAYSGWIRYNAMSARRVARLYEIARNGG